MCKRIGKLRIPVTSFLFSPVPYPDVTALSVLAFVEELLSFSEISQRSESNTHRYFSSGSASHVLSQGIWLGSHLLVLIISSL